MSTGPLEDLRAGGKGALARALAACEAAPDDPATLALLDAAASDPQGLVLGITGPPGVGKSTLISALLARLRRNRLTVGVIAVDPSSRRSGGALLGDRARLVTDPEDHGLFVRSMAARERLGGLAAETYAALVLMRAVFDRVIVETVGVGQSETEVALVADLVLLCVQPGSGDSLQYMKAGIAEAPDLAVVTKADLGPLAEEAASELRTALSLAGGTAPPVLTVSATTGDGPDALHALLEERLRSLLESGDLAARRAAQHRAWVEAAAQAAGARLGLALCRGLNRDRPSDQPFAQAAEVTAHLRGLGAP